MRLEIQLVLIDFSNAKAAAIARNSKLNNALADIKRRDPKRAAALASDPRALLFETPVEQLRVLAAFEGNVMCAPFVSHFDLEKAYTDDIESLWYGMAHRLDG
jgi:hypothetical protein